MFPQTRERAPAAEVSCGAVLQTQTITGVIGPLSIEFPIKKNLF